MTEKPLLGCSACRPSIRLAQTLLDRIEQLEAENIKLKDEAENQRRRAESFSQRYYEEQSLSNRGRRKR